MVTTLHERRLDWIRIGSQAASEYARQLIPQFRRGCKSGVDSPEGTSDANAALVEVLVGLTLLACPIGDTLA